MPTETHYRIASAFQGRARAQAERKVSPSASSPIDLTAAIARLTGSGPTSQRLLTDPRLHTTSRAPSYREPSGTVLQQRRMIEHLLGKNHTQSEPTNQTPPPPKDRLRFEFVDNKTGQPETIIFETTSKIIGRAQVIPVGWTGKVFKEHPGGKNFII